MSSLYKEKALKARRKVLEMIYKAQTSHIASNFSVIDIAAVLYENLQEKDVVVWSKGWASATIYYFLAQKGFISEEDLNKFPNAPYIGLAETMVNGVLCNGGAVGHGTPIATGFAFGRKRAHQQGNVFCILSDGEMNEGTVWESALFAAHHELDNLIFVIDCNKWQAMDRTVDVINMEPIEKHWEGFGWNVMRINGHDHYAIEWSITTGLKKGQPNIIICDTIKGKGVQCFEDKILYHYKNIEESVFIQAMKELV